MIFILTGAGISADSGIATFRDSDGLWENHDVRDVATVAGFRRDPALVWRFYSERRRQIAKAQPNAAHLWIAELQKKVRQPVFLCTQNIDDLHERAGSQNVVHVHGRVFATRCHECATVEEDRQEYDDKVPQCATCSGNLRPDVVWFGEMIDHTDLIYKALKNTNVFLAVGTSGHVEPVASFVKRAGMRNALTIYCGKEEPMNARHFKHVILGNATETMKKAVPLLKDFL